MILGVYALIPFVAVALKKFDKKIFLFPFVLFFIYSVGFSTINNLMFAYMPDHMMELRFDLAFSGGVWGIYLVTGYFLKQGVMKKASNLLLLLGLTASLAAAFLYVLLPCSDKGVFFNSVIWYDNIFVFTSSVMLFELLSRLKNIGGMWYKPVRFIAKYAFPLYLTHNIAILSLAPFVDKINILFSVKILILFAAGVGIGLVVSWLLAKIPKIGTYITYVKD